MKKASTSITIILQIFIFIAFIGVLSLFLQDLIQVESFTTNNSELIRNAENAFVLIPEEFENINDIQNTYENAVIFVTTNWCGSCGQKIRALLSQTDNFQTIAFFIADLEANRSFMNDIDIFLPETLILIDSTNYVAIQNIRPNLIPQRLNQLQTTGTAFLE